MFADLRNRGPNYRKAYERRNRKRLEKFLADPETEYAAGYTSSKSFGWELLFYCLSRVNRDPCAVSDPRIGQAAARVAHDFFDRFAQDRKRVPIRRDLAHCQRFQALGIIAAGDRSLGEPEKAEAQIRRPLAEMKCPACRADFHRRLAVILAFQGRFSEAFAEMECAIGLHRALGHSGHNLDRNGLAACFFGRATIHWLRVDVTSGIEDALEALRLVDPQQSPNLYRAALSHATWNVKRSASLGVRSHEIALSTVDAQLAALLEEAMPSCWCGKLMWFRGMIAALRGDLSTAADNLFQSQRILLEKCKPFDVGIVTADMVAICCLHGRLERAETALLRLSYGQRGRRWYTWLPEPFRDLLHGAAEAVQVGDTGKTASFAKRLRDSIALTEMPDLVELIA